MPKNQVDAPVENPVVPISSAEVVSTELLDGDIVKATYADGSIFEFAL